MSANQIKQRRARLLGRGLAPLMAVAAGAAADTNIAIAGITKRDVIIGALMFDTGVPSNVTDEVVIASNGNIQLTTTDSTGNTLVVFYSQG